MNKCLWNISYDAAVVLVEETHFFPSNLSLSAFGLFKAVRVEVALAVCICSVGLYAGVV